MKRRELKEIIHQLLEEINLEEDGIASSAGGLPANATPNISGYDAPFGSMVRRKIHGKSKKKVIKRGKK